MDIRRFCLEEDMGADAPSINDSVQSLKVEDMVNHLSDLPHGLHCLIIYPDLMTLREFYTCYIRKQIEEKKKVVLFNPFYETDSSVRRAFSDSHKVIDVNKYEKTESLIINDSLKEYFGQSNPMDSKQKLIELANRKGKDGLSVIADMGPYFFKMEYDELLEYELSLPTSFGKSMSGLCIYHHNDFNRLSEEQRQHLVEYHSIALKLESH
jgi:hypothetical protein